MKLFISNQYQDPIEISIEPTAKIIDLKNMIASKINGLVPMDQILKYNSTTLNNLDTLQSSGIRADSVLDLLYQNSHKIFIRTENDQVHDLDVHFTNTVELVKKLLNRLLKIAVDDQQLLLNGKELRNGDILTEKGVIRGITIHLIVINLNLRINIVRQSGQSERIEMKKNSTVAELKQLIYAKYKVPHGYANLTYNGQVLDNPAKTFADLQIKDLSEIKFRPQDMELHISSTIVGRKTMTFRVFPVDTIGQVKDKIKDMSKIDNAAQQIIWKGRVVADDKILSEQLITNGSTLNLVLNIQSFTLNIQIDPVEAKIPVAVQSDETISQLKTKLVNVTKIPIEQQILFLDNTKLEDAKLLIEYDLNQSSNVVLQRLNSFQILIQSHTGKTITINAHKDDLVSDIKKIIDQRLLIDAETQHLLYGDKELQDANNLEEYGITNKCTIHVVMRLRGG